MIQPAEARTCFEEVFAYEADAVAAAPGRVNLIGEHTDYNEGFVLPMAIELGVTLAYARRDDDIVRAYSTAFDEVRQIIESPAGSQWTAYVAGVFWAMRSAGMPVGGMDLAILSDLPIGAGLASSAALEMAVARAIVAATGSAWDPPAMALVAKQAENEFVGVPCGVMDQFAAAMCVEGHALLLDCRSLETRPVAIPDGATIVVMDTGVRRKLGSSEYRDRRAACERAVGAIRAIAPEVRALRDVDRTLLDRARGRMDAEAYRRAQHVIGEIARPLAMAEALEAGELAVAGRLMNDSHASLRDLYEVSSPELDAIVSAAQAHPACFGARMTGAGFGGCAVALVASPAVTDFVERVARRAKAYALQKAASGIRPDRAACVMPRSHLRGLLGASIRTMVPALR